MYTGSFLFDINSQGNGHRKTSMYYVCTSCQAFYEQPLGRMLDKKSDNGNVNQYPRTTPGPPVSDKCPECDSTLHASHLSGLSYKILIALVDRWTYVVRSHSWYWLCLKSSFSYREPFRSLWNSCSYEGYAHCRKRGEFSALHW